MKTLFVWRHGQTDFNVEHRLQGQVSTPLNEVGLAQAAAAAQVLSRESVTHIVSSPLERALQTAQALADRVGLEVVCHEGLLERSYGPWEGLTTGEIERRWPQEYAQWRNSGECPQMGIETRGAVGERVGQCLREVMAGVGEDAAVVAVSHGSALNAGVTHLLGVDPQGWSGLRGLNNAHVGVVREGRRPPGWCVERWNWDAGDVA